MTSGNETIVKKRTVLSWILYDFANTIYSMNVVTMYFPLWMTVNLVREDLWVSVGNALSMALVAVTMPVIGAVSDGYRCKMPFLICYTLLCVCATFLIGVSGMVRLSVVASALMALLFYIVANYAYQGGLVFYNALLPEVSTPRNIGKVSGYGVAFGYFGAIVGLLLVMPFVTGGISFLGIEFPRLARDAVLIAPVRGESSYLDMTVDRNGYYEYKIVPEAAETASEFLLSARDTVVVSSSGVAARALSLSMRKALAHMENSGVERWHIQRREKGWGHAGSFMPTAVLFLLTSLPIFVFIRDSGAVTRSYGVVIRSSVKAGLPAVIFTPFLILFPLILVVVNPLFSRPLVKRFIATDSGEGPAGDRYWAIALFKVYALFVCARVIDKIRGVQSAVFRKNMEDILRSLVDTTALPGVLRFLVAKFFYEDGIETVIIFMAVYAVKVVGFTSDVLVPFFLVATTAATVGSLLCGFVTDRLGPKRTLTLVLIGWILSIAAVILLRDRMVFWGVACCIGICMGSTWTSARPMLISLVPESRLGEFFGLYALSGKVASIIGPLMWGGVVFALSPYGDIVKYKSAIAVLGLMMFTGLLILLKVPDTVRARSRCSS